MDKLEKRCQEALILQVTNSFKVQEHCIPTGIDVIILSHPNGSTSIYSANGKPIAMGVNTPRSILLRNTSYAKMEENKRQRTW